MMLWIVRLPDDVKLNITTDDFIEELHRFFILSATSNVNHNLNIRISGAYTGRSTSQQNGKGFIRLRYLTLWPHHAIIYFITHLHHVRTDAFGHETFDDFV